MTFVQRRLIGWLAPIAVAMLAFGLRIWNLGSPNRLMFDETYYAKDAWSLLQFGYVREFSDNADERIVDGDLSTLTRTDPAQIAHPDAGKWLIALGEQLFGMNSFGWRSSAAIVGALTVLVLSRLVLRLTKSILIGCLAGLLLTFDGLHFVMSRAALLDVFLTFWIVCAVTCLVADRDWIRARLNTFHPFRPWQLAAGVCFGLACATKWNGLYALAGFGVWTVVCEVLARRRQRQATGIGRGFFATWFAVGLPAFLSIVGVAFVVYLASWTGLLNHYELYARRFGGADDPWIDGSASGWFASAVDALRTLWQFHVITWNFHTGDYLATAEHPYASNPWGWLLLERPVAFDAVNDIAAERCGAAADSSCLREVLALGNPAVWWTGLVVLIVSPMVWWRTRDWRWSVPLTAVAVSWLPWFLNSDRPIFQFYSVALLPFVIVAICLMIDTLGRRFVTLPWKYLAPVAAMGLLALTIALFWWFYPIYTGQVISREAWQLRMWFSSWI